MNENSPGGKTLFNVKGNWAFLDEKYSQAGAKMATIFRR